MKIIPLLWPVLIPAWCFTQTINITGIWEIQCPRTCNCEVVKFSDLPIHQWASVNVNIQENFHSDQNYYQNIDNDQPMDDELMKVATCVLAEDITKLLASLPPDLQVLSILESGVGDKEFFLRSADMNRFPDLLSLNIHGMEYEDRLRNSGANLNLTDERYGIVLDVDALLPLGQTLRYLNLERVTLSSQSTVSESLVVTSVNEPSSKNFDDDLPEQTEMINENSSGLIFLPNSGNREIRNEEEREILPYNVYKQEIEAHREAARPFTGLDRLTHLRVYDCALKDISWQMFDGLENLVFLSLDKNGLKIIPKFCFYGTPILQFLSLAYNQLLTLDSVDLAGLLALKRLDLRGNNLTFLSELSLPPFPALLKADFTGNPLDAVYPSTFEIMNATTTLYLGGDGAQLMLQENSFLGLRLLEVLHLFNLDIRILERVVFRGMPALRELKMRGNITRIDFDAFSELKNLVDLDLSDCQLEDISMDAFYGLEKVRRVDLSLNNLETIPSGLFTRQQQIELKEIILNKNKLTTLPTDFFKNLRSPYRQHQISNLRLDENPWDCNCAMIYWNSNLVNRVKETAPRCMTPTNLRNWGVFYALRKGGLQCRRINRRNIRGSQKRQNFEEKDNIS